MNSEYAVIADAVSKKFRKGEFYDSLRDLIPAMVGRVFRGNLSGGLGKTEFWALDEVSFQVKKGEAFGIIGRNGAGKSTMLKLLSRIMNPTTGNLTINGRLSALIEIGAGFHPDLTGRENVFLNGVILGMSRKEIERKFDEIVEFSGVEEFIDTPVKRYSSGMHARLGFSVAAHLEPDVLVIDEVLSVGDAAFRKKGVEKMKSVATSGATVIYVSHDLPSVAELCERCILLDRGKVVAEGPAGDVVNRYLHPGTSAVDDDKTSGVAITAVNSFGAAGQAIHFESGESARIDIEVLAYERMDGLIAGVEAWTDQGLLVFSLVSSRLGAPLVDIDEGETAVWSFDVQLNLGAGTYYAMAYVTQGDWENEVARMGGLELRVSPSLNVEGLVNLNPRVHAQVGKRGSAEAP